MLMWINEIDWSDDLIWLWNNIANINSMLSVVARIFSGLVFAGGAVATIMRLISTHRIDQHINMQDKYKKIKHNLKYYIPTRIQKKDPCEKDGYNTKTPSKDAVPFFINQIFSSSEKQYYLVLADSGMGKTTFLEKLFITYYKKKLKKYDIFIFSLGRNDSMDRIKEIQKPEKTILLLDALDEDTNAMKKYKKRLNTICETTRLFNKVIITCRTQFFPDRDSESDYQMFKKYYVSPFNDNEIEQYLRKKYNSIFEKSKIERAKKVIDKCPHLMARPMILAYIDDLLSDENREYKYSFELYSELVNKWIKREQIKNVNKYLYAFSEKVALYMYNKGTSYIESKEIKSLCTTYFIDFKPGLARTRSLLNRNAEGQYKFAHMSILEYFLAKKAFDDIEFRKTMTSDDSDGYELTKTFFEEMCIDYLNAKVKHDSITDMPLKLYNRSFEFFQLQNTILEGMEIVECDFMGCNLQDANLKSAYLNHVNLCKANLKNARLQNAYLEDVKFLSANLVTARLEGAEFTNADFTGANLINANFENANLFEANFKNANIMGACFTGADLRRANLAVINLAVANLRRANLTEVDLEGVNLAAVDLTGVNFIGANLKGVNLTGAKLIGAQLSGVDLRETNITGANITGANLSGVNLSGASLTRVIMKKSDLRDADLTGAVLTDVNLTDVDLRGAKMKKIQLRNVIITGAKLDEWQRTFVMKACNTHKITS